MNSLISVVTPTYQRRETLPRLYASLLEQSHDAFEWVVLDDGSDDGSEELVRDWAREAPFPIIYAWQPNQGKHAALNRGFERATGEFCAVIDSDDWYLPIALESMSRAWEGIPAARRAEFANVEGLCIEEGGGLSSDRFPAPVFDSDTFEIEALHGVHGDTKGMYRRDVLLRFPFPEDLGWHISPALVWNRIAAHFHSRFVNEIWAYNEYRPEGLSGRETRNRLRYPEAQLLYWREYAAMPRRMKASSRFRANANLIRYALITGRLRSVVGSASHRPWLLAAAPAGYLLYRRDRPLLAEIAAEPGP